MQCVRHPITNVLVIITFACIAYLLICVYNLQDQYSKVEHTPEATKRTRISVSGGTPFSQTSVEMRFAERLSRLRTLCAKESYKLLPLPDDRPTNANAFGFDRLVWCRIPKVASSYTRVYQKQLLHFTNDQEVGDAGVIVKDYKGEKRHFFVVRDPYSRVVSGFIDKGNANPQYYTGKLGKSIIKNYRDSATNQEKECGGRFTFSELIKYIISSYYVGSRQSHDFRPYYQMCRMCGPDMDLIAHLETLKDDMQYIFKTVGIHIDFEYDGDQFSLEQRCNIVIKSYANITKVRECDNMCDIFKSMWWSHQARGLIAKGYKSPFPDQEEACKKVTVGQCIAMVKKAYAASAGTFDKGRQKREFMRQLFSQISLEDRRKLREIYQMDFELFGYDPTPRDVFPEFYPS